MPNQPLIADREFLEKVQQLLAGCQNEEHLLLKTTVIVNHLLNEYCVKGSPPSSKAGIADLSIKNKWYILMQSVDVPVHTAVCMNLLIEQQALITANLYYSRFKFGRMLSTLSARYPAIADHIRQSALLGAKYALTLLCCEVIAIAK